MVDLVKKSPQPDLTQPMHIPTYKVSAFIYIYIWYVTWSKPGYKLNGRACRELSHWQANAFFVRRDQLVAKHKWSRRNQGWTGVYPGFS